MPYFLMLLQVVLYRSRMNAIKRGILQLQNPQKMIVIELLIVAFMVLTVGVALQYPYLSTYKLILDKLWQSQAWPLREMLEGTTGWQAI